MLEDALEQDQGGTGRLETRKAVMARGGWMPDLRSRENRGGGNKDIQAWMASLNENRLKRKKVINLLVNLSASLTLSRKDTTIFLNVKSNHEV